jgi:hypothetical protein
VHRRIHTVKEVSSWASDVQEKKEEEEEEERKKGVVVACPSWDI